MKVFVRNSPFVFQVHEHTVIRTYQKDCTKSNTAYGISVIYKKSKSMYITTKNASGTDPVMVISSSNSTMSGDFHLSAWPDSGYSLDL
jgi:hypothetical protein